jgi:hypothetical protein
MDMNLDSFSNCRKCTSSIATSSDAVRFNWRGRGAELIEVAATAERWAFSS